MCRIFLKTIHVDEEDALICQHDIFICPHFCHILPEVDVNVLRNEGSIRLIANLDATVISSLTWVRHRNTMKY